MADTFLNRLLAVTTALVPVTALASNNAVAQEPPTEVEEIEVRGQRLSQSRAVQVKRDASQILDAISSDDIGLLPDFNTAAAVLRLPGVAVQNDQGEARYPILRGLNQTYNRVTVNGFTVASPEFNDRGVPLDIVSSSLAQRIEVVKVMTPDMDPNAIGGTINIVTRSALERGAPFFFGDLSFAHWENSGEVRDSDLSWRGNFAAGTTFGSEGEFGVTVGANYFFRDSDIPQVEVDNADWVEFNDAGEIVDFGAGNGNAVPRNSRQFFYNNERERLGGNVKLQWDPGRRFNIEANGYLQQFNDNELRDENEYESRGDLVSQDGDTGVFAGGTNIVTLGRFILDRSVYGGNIDIEYTPNRAWSYNLRAGYSGATFDNPEQFDRFQSPEDLALRFEADTFFPRYEPLDPVRFNDQSLYAGSYHQEFKREVQDDIYEVMADVAYDTEFEGWKAEFAAGGIFRTTDRRFAFTDFERFVPDEGLGYTLDDVSRPGPTQTLQDGARLDPRIDPAEVDAFFDANRDSFTIAGFSESVAVTNDYEVDEDIYGGYLQADADIGRVQVIAGVRVEHTDVGSSAVQVIDGVFTPVSQSGGYTNVLPTVIGRYNITESLVLRGAYSRTIGRPDYGDIAVTGQVSFAPEPVTNPDSPANNSTLNQGNPDLEPRISDNIDLSLEWYIPKGLLSVALFYKDVSNEIFTVTERNVERDLGRGPELVDITQPRNTEDAKIRGLEIAYVQSFPFLPAPLDGLGISANATFLDTDYSILLDGRTVETQFFQQPDRLYNVSVFYQREFIELRVAYNYTAEFLDSIADDIAQFEYWEDRRQVDAQIRFRATENLTLVIDGQNVTDEGRREVTGPNRDLLQEDANFGRTVWFGINAAF